MEGVEKGTQQLKLGKSSLSKMFCVTLVIYFMEMICTMGDLKRMQIYIYLSCSMITVIKDSESMNRLSNCQSKC